LSEILPGDIFVGTSLIIRHGDRFLFGLRPPKRDGDDVILEVTGIGGGLEDSDHSFTEGARREAMEEIGCEVRLLSCDPTLVVQDHKTIEWVEISGEKSPVAIVFRNYRTPTHQPWSEQNQGRACILIYLAELADKPLPDMELPWLLWLSPDQILEMASQDVPLQQIIQSNGDLILGAAGLPPPGLLRMTDSQEALALAMGSETTDLYRRLLRI
jgi:8-oxo-dGTP pyrophosphatase MutT (NUDIX family)